MFDLYLYILSKFKTKKLKLNIIKYLIINIYFIKKNVRRKKGRKEE